MMTLTKLNDVYEDWLTGGGVFSDLNNLEVPWKDETKPNLPLILDMTYHGAHSGDKNISPLVYKIMNTEGVTTPKDKLASVIYNMFGDKWAREWEIMQAEYNPIENYNMVETETPAEVTHTITPAETTQTITPAGTTNTTRPAETTTTDKPAKVTTENGISAFNSSGYSDDTKTTVTGDNNDKGSSTLTVNVAGSDTFRVDSAGTNTVDVDAAGTDILTVQNDRELTRSGNIGTTTTQMMIESELKLREWLYFEHVFKDIDNILTLSIY